MHKQRGFIGYIFLILIALAALKYFFDWSIFEAATTEAGRATVGYMKDILVWIKEFIISLWSYVH